ncbi:uncharacterized protein LOC125236932 [Leguminivora glycinivorella]|uniref:uncharacterized protein LOC125236932 n=1 Tax=Leguminivora glycinivorella TaxID=1035111 RepID=UPI00200CD982|nr:uncharacterized protein LOC125236932 [Leguminivora glycinivorella]
MYLLAVIFVFGTCQASKGFRQSDFAKSDQFLEPPENPQYKSWLSWRSVVENDHPDDHDYYDDARYKSLRSKPEEKPPEIDGHDNIKDLYKTLTDLDKWAEFRTESKMLMQKYADVPKDEQNKELLRQELNVSPDT